MARLAEQGQRSGVGCRKDAAEAPWDHCQESLTGTSFGEKGEIPVFRENPGPGINGGINDWKGANHRCPVTMLIFHNEKKDNSSI